MPRRSSQPCPKSTGLKSLATAAGLVASLGTRTVVMGVIVMAAIVVATLARPLTAAAGEGDATKKLVLQNERVRAVSNYYPAGASVPEHEHTAPRAVVAIEGGTIEIRDANGKVSTLSLKNGDIVWRPPEKHSIVNVGSTPVRVVEIDVLDCPKR